MIRLFRSTNIPSSDFSFDREMSDDWESVLDILLDDLIGKITWKSRHVLGLSVQIIER